MTTESLKGCFLIVIYRNRNSLFLVKVAQLVRRLPYVVLAPGLIHSLMRLSGREIGLTQNDVLKNVSAFAHDQH